MPTSTPPLGSGGPTPTCSWPPRTATGRTPRGAGGGPLTTAPVAASKTPPWHGQRKVPSPPKSTVHPACEQTALDAAKRRGLGCTTYAGRRVPGSRMATAPPTGTVAGSITSSGPPGAQPDRDLGGRDRAADELRLVLREPDEGGHRTGRTNGRQLLGDRGRRRWVEKSGVEQLGQAGVQVGAAEEEPQRQQRPAGPLPPAHRRRVLGTGRPAGDLGGNRAGRQRPALARLRVAPRAAGATRTRSPRTGRRNVAVWLSATVATSSGGPSATTRPPPSPPSGPMSTIQSAVFTTSRLCSMTTTVLPASTSRPRTPSSLRMSSKCRPVVGSSRM